MPGSILRTNRLLSGGLAQPIGSTLIADFTDGTHTLSGLTGSGLGGDVQSDAGFPNTTTRSYTLDSRGIGMSFQAGTTGQYAAVRYIPDGKNAGALIDLSGSGYIAIEIEFPEGGGQTFDAIELWIAQQTGNTFTNYLNYTAMSGADKNPKRCVVVARFSSMTKTAGGPANMAQVGKIDVRFSVHASAQNIPAQIYIRRIWKGANAPRVIFCFDDCWSTQLTIAKPILDAAGFKATVFPSTSHVGISQRMTLSDLTTLYAAGWDIGCHLENHDTDIPCNLPNAGGLTAVGTTATWVNKSNIAHGYANGQAVPIIGAMQPEYNGTFVITVGAADTFTYTMSGSPSSPAQGWPSAPRYAADAQMIQGFVNSRAYLKQQGFTRAADMLAFPNGAYNDYVCNLLIAQGFKMGRTSNTGAMPASTGRAFDPRGASGKSLLQLPSGILDQVTGASALTWVANAIERGLSIILYGHKQAPGVGVGTLQTMDTAELQALVTGVLAYHQQGLCVAGQTFSQFYFDMILKQQAA